MPDQMFLPVVVIIRQLRRIADPAKAAPAFDEGSANGLGIAVARGGEAA